MASPNQQSAESVTVLMIERWEKSRRLKVSMVNITKRRKTNKVTWGFVVVAEPRLSDGASNHFCSSNSH